MCSWCQEVSCYTHEPSLFVFTDYVYPGHIYTLASDFYQPHKKKTREDTKRTPKKNFEIYWRSYRSRMSEKQQNTLQTVQFTLMLSLVALCYNNSAHLAAEESNYKDVHIFLYDNLRD